jgi:hypothetical protein
MDYLASMLIGVHGYEDISLKIGSVPGIGINNILSIDDKSFYHSSTLADPLSVVVSAARLMRLKTLGMDVLSGLVNNAKSKVEKRILRTAKWFGRSVRMNGTAEKFLMAANAVEAAFTRGGDAPVSQNIADGIAFVVYKDAQSRRNVFDEIRKLYGKRSKLVHGNQDEVEEMELRKMLSYTFNLLCLLLMNIEKFKAFETDGRDGLECWVQEQKYGAAYDLVWPEPWSDGSQ